MNLLYCQDHDKAVIRCEDYFEYEYNGKKHLYFPDFVVNGVIIEIKGYYTELVDIKAAAVSKPYKILYKEDLIDILDYVIKTYGKNFTELYTTEK